MSAQERSEYNIFVLFAEEPHSVVEDEAVLLKYTRPEKLVQ